MEDSLFFNEYSIKIDKYNFGKIEGYSETVTEHNDIVRSNSIIEKHNSSYANMRAARRKSPVALLINTIKMLGNFYWEILLMWFRLIRWIPRIIFLSNAVKITVNSRTVQRCNMCVYDGETKSGRSASEICLQTFIDCAYLFRGKNRTRSCAHRSLSRTICLARARAIRYREMKKLRRLPPVLHV